MARHESDRDDLIAEATALRERVELQVADAQEPVVAGFHRDGRLSVYFGADPAYHFDSGGRLRRAFVDGNLYRSRGDTLSRLTRERTDTATGLLRHDLGAEELSSFLIAMRSRLVELRRQFEQGRVIVLRQIPPEGDVAGQVQQALGGLSTEMLSPALKK